MSCLDSNNSLPFLNLTNSEFEALNNRSSITDSFANMDRLSQLKFDPFQLGQHLAASSNNNINLDSSYDTSNIQCDYYAPNDFKTLLENKNLQTYFSLFHLNVRSISNKFDQFKDLIYTLKIPFQIIELTETWLDDNNMDCFTLRDYEYIGSNRPANIKGGGVGMYMSEKLTFKIRSDLSKNIDHTVETIFIEITIKNGKNIIIGVVYRPPNSKFEIFINSMNTILEKIDKENKHCYLLGDFNIDLLKSESCDYTNHFVEQLFTSCFFPLINKPTKITNHTATLIDNIFTNNFEILNDSTNALIFTDISDHLPIVHMVNMDIADSKSNKRLNNIRYQRIITKSSTDTFKDAIKNISWSSVYREDTNPEKAFNEFLNSFLNEYKANFPAKKNKNY